MKVGKDILINGGLNVKLAELFDASVEVSEGYSTSSQYFYYVLCMLFILFS